LTGAQAMGEPRTRRTGRKLAVAALALLVPLVVLELWLRRGAEGEPPPALPGRTSYELRGESAAGEALDAKRHGIVMRHDPYLVLFPRPSQALPGVTINAQGFRGRDWELAKPPGAVRVLLVGGSTAFGQGATDDEASLGAALERELAGRIEGAEVLNGGVIGYESTQELVLLATRLLAYGPDVVVVLDGWNDFHHAGRLPTDRTVVANTWFFELDARLARGAKPWAGLWRSSALLAWVETKLSARRPAPEEREFGHYADELAAALPIYRWNLACMTRLARAHGARVLLAAQPELYMRAGTIPEREQRIRERRARSGYADYSRAQYPAYVETAREVAAGEGAAFLDATKVFDGSAEAVFIDEVHLDDGGQARLAAALAEAVQGALAQPTRD
jgi:lysophospholipase L1-like esterase